MFRASLDEPARRLWAAAAAAEFGRGGINAVRGAIGPPFETAAHGSTYLVAGDAPPAGRARRPGARLQESTLIDPALKSDLNEGAEAAGREIAEPHGRSFLWTGELAELLAGLEKKRMEYPKLDAFMPQVAGFFGG